MTVPAGERIVFVGTDRGSIRMYKYPINGDYHEYKCQSRPVTRLAVTPDGNVVVVASEDGSVFILDVRDDVASKLRKEQVLPLTSSDF